MPVILKIKMSGEAQAILKRVEEIRAEMETHNVEYAQLVETYKAKVEAEK